MLIRKSIEYAFGHYPVIPDYIKQHAQEMNEEVMRQHINLYVNQFSLSLGGEGKSAIEKMKEVFLEQQPDIYPSHSSSRIFLS